MRSFIEAGSHVTLPVLGLASVTLPNGRRAPALGANHPSFFWCAASRSGPLALKVMTQDLIAACWQARTAADGRRSAARVVRQCTQHRDARPRAACILTEMQVFNQTPTQARANCDVPAATRLADAREISDEAAARITRGTPLGALPR